MSVCIVSLDSLCKLPVQISVYCARRIPAHLRCILCSILLHLIDICFLPCLYRLYRKSILVVVGPGLVSTSPTSMRSSASHPAGPHNRPKRVAGSVNTICTAVCQTTVTDPPRLGCVI